MSGHTPGPWNIDPNEALIVSTRISVQFIAMLGDAIGDFGNAWDDPCMTEEVKANARLIAAAPEMYEALVYARNVLPNDKWADDARGIIVAAIAKAEGKS